MALFSNKPWRSAATAAIAVSIAHYVMKSMSSVYAFQLTQTSIAIFSISALLFMIMMHHRMDGQLLTRSQEEMALIGIFALFWIALLVAWKFFAKKQGGVSTNLGIPNASRNQDVSTSNDLCSDDGVYCIFEEYTWF